MRHILAVLLVVFFQACALFALTVPSDSDVQVAYQAYRDEICKGSGMMDTSGKPLPSCTVGGMGDAGARRITLEEYCAHGGTAAICSIVNGWEKALRLSYDHATGNWSTPTGDLGKRTELDINHIPTASLARGERLFAVIDGTNPLLYSVTAAEVKEENTEQLADLQKLVGLLGGNIAAVLSARASSTSIAAGIFDADVTALQAVADDMKKAQCITTAATHYSFSAVSFIQDVESANDGFYDLSDDACDTMNANAKVFDQTWLTLLADQGVIGQQCSEAFDALAALEGSDSTKFVAVRQALTTYAVALQNPKCAHFNAAHSSDIQAQFIGDIDAAVEAKDAAVLEHQLDVLRSQLGLSIGVMQVLIKNGGDALQTLVTGGGTVRKALASRAVFRNRVMDALIKAPTPCSAPKSSDACAASGDVARIVIVKGGPAKVTWDKVQTHPIHIAADSPYLADVIPTRPTPVDTSYKAKSISSAAYDVGVAVTKTRLESPIFGVVKNDAGKTVIGVTDEETRSGKLALMFNYLPLRQLLPNESKQLTSLGVQIGAGLDTGNPAFFYGVSYGFGKYVRLGWGETSQRVKALHGQKVGGEVPDKDAIRTRQSFDKATYFSLTISIGSLKFFSGT